MAIAVQVTLSVLSITAEPLEGLCTRCWNPALVRVTILYIINLRGVDTRVTERCRDCDRS